MVINCDMVVAARGAAFALPEVKRGVVAVSGALPRLARIVGRQRAMEMALTGRTVGAQEALAWGLVNRVVEDVSGAVVAAAVEMARAVVDGAPEAVALSRMGVASGLGEREVDEATRWLLEEEYPRLLAGENIKEGLSAFVEKRRPQWRETKL